MIKDIMAQKVSIKLSAPQHSSWKLTEDTRKAIVYLNRERSRGFVNKNMENIYIVFYL